MKAAVAVITLAIVGLVLAGATILGSSGPRSAPRTASSNTATPASAVHSHCTDHAVSSRIGHPRNAGGRTSASK